MAVEGDWICRACWTSNPPRDDRCYKCHTPRGADEATVQKQQATIGRKAAAKNDEGGILDALLALPVVVFRWYGRLLLIGGILFLGLTVLVASNDQAPELAWLAWLAASGACVGAGILMRWASGAMRDRNPAAFAVALVVSLGIAGLTILALQNLPPGTGNPNWMRYGTLIIFGVAAMVAAAGLLSSLRGDKGSEDV